MSSDTSTGCTASCGSAVDSGLYLCTSHSAQLAEVLSGVPALVRDLEVTITRQNRTSSERHGSRSSTTPLPWNEHASIAAVTLAEALNSASIAVAEAEQHDGDRLTEVGAYDTANLARWLGRNSDTLRRLPEAGDLYARLCDAVTVARRATDRPPERVPYGRCGAEDPETGVECPEYVYGRRGAPYVRCRCGATHEAAVRRDWMLSQCRNLDGTAPQLASWLLMFDINATPDGVRSMARRKRDRIPERGRVGDSPLYRLVDVFAAYASSRSRVAHEPVSS